jgi:glycosyltransferase involved in cell wall biosynthesis
MEPMISIVLCTYHGERFLQEQIDSLLQQTWTNIEIIVSDDHSTDGTPQILRQYENDPRFHIYYQPVNIGAIKNFEFATALAKGDYIVFCDQDDIWLPGKIEKLYQAIGDHWLVYSDSLLVDEKGQSLGKQLSGLRRMYSGKDTRGFVFSNVVWGHAMMISRQLLTHVLPIPQGIPHDIWFAYKAATLTGIVYVDEPLNLYRQHAHTVTTTVATKAVTRTHKKRFRDFEEKLHWITVMHDHASPEEKNFYAELKQLYQLKAKGTTVWPLFRFLLRYQQVLFRFTNKSLLSRLVEIRKLSRGETPGYE